MRPYRTILISGLLALNITACAATLPTTLAPTAAPTAPATVATVQVTPLPSLAPNRKQVVGTIPPDRDPFENATFPTTIRANQPFTAPAAGTYTLRVQGVDFNTQQTVFERAVSVVP